MNQLTAFFLCVFAAVSLQARDPACARAAVLDARDLPKVLAPLDVKRAQNGCPSLDARTLRAQDFSLIENTDHSITADSIGKFKDSGEPIALIVALDASGSMNGRPLAAIQKGLAQLVSKKRPEDRVALLSFADDTRWETTWNSSKETTENAFRNLRARGDLTRIYDAVEDALSELNRQAAKDNNFPLRRCVLVLSDGHDEGSHTTLPQMLQDVTDSHVRFDTIGLAHSPLWLGSLRRLSQAGFGEFQATSSPEALTSLLGHGIDALLDMPVVRFSASHLDADGETHKLTVESKQNGISDVISAQMPKAFWRTRNALYCAPAAVVLLIGCFVLMRRQQPAPAMRQVPSPAPPVPSPPRQHTRMPTVAEPTSELAHANATQAAVAGASPKTYPMRYEVNTSNAAVNPLATPVKPVRVPTVLAPEPATQAASFSLTATAGPYAGQSFLIEEQEFWIGSALNNHLSLPADMAISGNHACIRTEHPFRRLYDNGSLNNTWINGTPVGKEIVLLRPGDRIRLGACEFMVECNGNA